MFEKEAEEYGLHQALWCTSESGDLRDAFKDGARFGYNKANEWHYVKDGDLPKANELVLIKITGRFVLGWTDGTNWFNDSNTRAIIDRRMVYAWKEIILPKEVNNASL